MAIIDYKRKRMEYNRLLMPWEFFELLHVIKSWNRHKVTKDIFEKYLLCVIILMRRKL